jgi:hypothetical protein
MQRTGQGGSVLGFVIGSVILAALLIGGVYYIHQQNNTAPVPTPQQPPTQTPSPQETPKPKQKDSGSNQSQPAPTQMPSNGGPIASHELPQTGPVESFATAVILALVSGVAVSYVRSRRRTASL